MINKILKILAYILVFASIIAVLGFAIDSNNKAVCREFVVSVKYSENDYFVDAEDVKETVYSVLGNIEGRIISEIDLARIETVVNEMDFIEKTVVYRTIDGQIRVIATPRMPIIRVINTYGHAYYIDDKGKLMPLCSNYSPRVPVIFGNIYVPYSSVLDLNHIDLTDNQKYLNDIYSLALYINSNPFWKAYVDHIYYEKDNNIEIIPKGNLHVIEFGKIEDIDYKFRKLKTFYTAGLTRVGWRNYNRINLKYRNQIVCSK